MDNEVDPRVLKVIDDKRLSGPRLTPVEIVTKMGVFDARDKPYDNAWLASGDTVIAALWAERIGVAANGRWFCVETLDTSRRMDGAARAANQVQRATDRLALLKRTFDGEAPFRAVLQTQRLPIVEVEANKLARVSSRVRDDEAWHVATWDTKRRYAVLVRGPRDWVPTDDDLEAGAAQLGVPAKPVEAPVPAEAAGADQLKDAARQYAVRHFGGYGYKVQPPADPAVGYDFEVLDGKGGALLRLAVRGTQTGQPYDALTPAEIDCSGREPLWRLLVVSDATGPVPQHKIYKQSELTRS